MDDLQKDDDVINLKVQDNGIGYPDNIESRFSGSLGMTLIKTLASQLDGNIKLYNQDGAVFETSFKKK